MSTNLHPKFPMNDRPAKKRRDWVVRENRLYNSLSPRLKVALAVLEEGLIIDKKGRLRFDENKGRSWLSKLARDLENEVSRDTIDRSLDGLLDQRILRHGETIMEQVSDVDGTKWVRAYYLTAEYISRLLWLYKATHELTKAKPEEATG